MKTNSSNLVGFSSVKAKTDFQLGTASGSDGLANLAEFTQVKFTSGSGAGAAADAYMLGALKKPVEIEGVFKEEKFKEFSGAKSTPAYYGIVFATNVSDQVTNTASCDGEKYVDTTTSIINEYIDLTLAEFYSNAIK